VLKISSTSVGWKTSNEKSRKIPRMPLRVILPKHECRKGRFTSKWRCQCGCQNCAYPLFADRTTRLGFKAMQSVLCRKEIFSVQLPVCDHPSVRCKGVYQDYLCCFNPARSNRSWLRFLRCPKRLMLCVTAFRPTPSAESSSQFDFALQEEPGLKPVVSGECPPGSDRPLGSHASTGTCIGTRKLLARR
jgi:hypothetical protein